MRLILFEKTLRVISKKGMELPLQLYLSYTILPCIFFYFHDILPLIKDKKEMVFEKSKIEIFLGWWKEEHTTVSVVQFCVFFFKIAEVLIKAFMKRVR